MCRKDRKPRLDNIGYYGKLFFQPHLDKKDMGFAFLSWFVKGDELLNFFDSYIMYFGMCLCFIYVFCLVFLERKEVGHIKMGEKFLLSE
jgi:hypothetical protein